MKEEKIYSGLTAFRLALTKQEGTFPRQVTALLNEPKALPIKRSETNNEKAASALLHRNPLGRFAKKAKDD